MTRHYGNPKRTNAAVKAAMETRLTLCTDWALDRITVRGKTLRINLIRNSDERDRLAIIDCTEVT